MSKHEFHINRALLPATLGAIGLISLGACAGGSGGPEVVSVVSDCGHNYEAPNVFPSAMIPTADKSNSDPTVLLAYQMAHKDKFQQIGEGTLVCINIDLKDVVNPPTRLLTEPAVVVANMISAEANAKFALPN